MSALALFVCILPFVTLSLFDYTQEECDDITILGVYASSTDSDTLIIQARNDRRDNVFSTRACMPEPRWKIYDTRLSTDVKFYGEQSDTSFSNPSCLIDRNYEVPKASNSISTIAEGDIASFRLDLYVTNDTNPAELACSYEWIGLITQQDICDEVKFNELRFEDGDNTADTLILNVSDPFDEFSCSFFAYPTFKIYNNANNKLWGKMDRFAQTYCLVSGEYPIVNNGSTDDIGFEPGQEISMTIEFWNNWSKFACSWEWDGTVTYDGSVRITTAEPTTTEGGTSSTPVLSPGDPVNTLDNKGGRIIVYYVGVVVLLLASLIL